MILINIISIHLYKIEFKEFINCKYFLFENQIY